MHWANHRFLAGRFKILRAEYFLLPDLWMGLFHRLDLVASLGAARSIRRRRESIWAVSTGLCTVVSHLNSTFRQR